MKKYFNFISYLINSILSALRSLVIKYNNHNTLQKNGLKPGSQLKISIDKINWQNVDITQDYPVWVLNFQGIA